MKRRGLTLLEIMIASVLLLYAAFALLSIYSTTARAEIHTQQRVLASMLGHNVLEEAEAHRFGLAAPADWKLGSSGLESDWVEQRVPVVVDGRPVEARFHILRLWRNGSMVGRAAQTDQDWDVFTAIITWREGNFERDRSGTFSNRYFADDNRQLVVQIPVWNP